jgi:hypothetical protein
LACPESLAYTEHNLSNSIFDNIPKIEGRPNYTVDIERFIGAPGAFVFREPKASDLFPRPEVEKMLKIGFPEFPAQMLQILMIMARCYVTQSGDGEINPARRFAQLARDRSDIYLYTVGEFARAFPIDIEQAIDEIPND